MKIEELYHELKEYPELISDRSPAEIKAVLKFTKNRGPIFSFIPKDKKASYDERAEDYTVPISNKPKNDSEQTFLSILKMINETIIQNTWSLKNDNIRLT